ncbi:MAG: hypothetical protein IKS68_01100, partial [Mailhella sp.]|nr:hypothetical protein [Mailhella sp.]
MAAAGRRCVLFFLMAWFSCVFSAHADGHNIWAKGQWEKDGAVDIFSSVFVKKDRSLVVIEKIDGLEGDLVYSLDRRHASSASPQGVPPLTISRVEADGKPVSSGVMVGRNKDGVPLEVRIPSPGPGKHSYAIRYTVRGRVLFSHEKYDELVWEPGFVCGASGIARVSCAVKLPDEAKLLAQESRLGKEGGGKETYDFVGKTGSALYRGEEYMAPGESFVVVARWSKGAVTPPGIWDEDYAGREPFYDIHDVVDVHKDGTIEFEAHLSGYSGTLHYSLTRVYASSSRFGESAPMEFVSATVDGRPAQASLTMSGANEPSSVIIAPPSKDGRHDYVLRLKTTDCVLFGSKDHDELTWDIGRASRRARVACTIRLPEGAEVLGQRARLGHETTNHKPVEMSAAQNEALFKGMGFMEEGES